LSSFESIWCGFQERQLSEQLLQVGRHGLRATELEDVDPDHPLRRNPGGVIEQGKVLAFEHADLEQGPSDPLLLLQVQQDTAQIAGLLRQPTPDELELLVDKVPILQRKQHG
jgi:hypothetical protein